MEKVAPHYPNKVIVLNERFLNKKLLNLADWSPNNQKQVHLKAFCSWSFTSMFITTNGNVSFCCNDFLFEEVIGNVGTQSLVEIWHGGKFNYVRRHLAVADRSFNRLCKVCNAHGFSYEWVNPLDEFIMKYVIGRY